MKLLTSSSLTTEYGGKYVRTCSFNIESSKVPVVLIKPYQKSGTSFLQGAVNPIHACLSQYVQAA